MSNEKKIKFGHTSILWKDSDIESAVKTIAELGFYGVETFGWVVVALEKEGRSDIFEKYDIPLVSSYFSANIVDMNKWNETMDKVTRWAKLLVKHNCKKVVLGGDGVNRKAFNFEENKNTIINSINEIGKNLADYGILCCFHPHTGTPVEVEHEIRTVMEAIDTNYIAFAPDVGQIAKGGTDPLCVVKDYYPLVRHMHLKDFIGGTVEFNENGQEIDTTGFLCYTPLGQGVVDIPAILDIIESNPFDGYVMVELDGTHYSAIGSTPITPEEGARISKEYLESLGYKFRSR